MLYCCDKSKNILKPSLIGEIENKNLASTSLSRSMPNKTGKTYCTCPSSYLSLIFLCKCLPNLPPGSSGEQLVYPLVLFGVFVLMLCVVLSCDLRDEDEMESFLAWIRHVDSPWSLSGLKSGDALLEARLRWVYTKRRKQQTIEALLTEMVFVVISLSQQS